MLCCGLLWFSMGQFYPCSSGLLHRDNHMIASVPVSWPWWTWMNNWQGSIKNWYYNGSNAKHIPQWFFSCNQAALRTLLSVCLSVYPSVCPSVCHTFLTMFLSSYHQNFQEILLLPDVMSMQGQGQRSKVKVTEVMTPLSRFRTVIPLWINIWRWHDAQSLILLRRGALLFFKVIHQISRSHS